MNDELQQQILVDLLIRCPYCKKVTRTTLTRMDNGNIKRECPHCDKVSFLTRSGWLEETEQ